MSKELDILFDDYLQGSLNAEERLLFESRLATDQEFANEFELHQLLANGIAAEKEARFRKILQEERKETFIGNNTWGKKFTVWSAAIVLFGMIGLVFSVYRNYNPNITIARNKQDTASKSNSQKRTIEALEEATEIIISKSDTAPIINKPAEIIEIEDDAAVEIDLLNEDMDNPDMDEIASIANDVLLASTKIIVKERKEIVKALDKEIVSTNAPVAISTSETTTRMDEVQALKREKKRKEDLQTKDEKKKADELADIEPANIEKTSPAVPAVVANKKVPEPKEAKQIDVSFYKSPINYKGYKYDEENNKLDFYGLSPDLNELIAYKDVLYFKNQTKIYKIVPNQDFSKLILVTDKLIIEALK